MLHWFLLFIKYQIWPLPKDLGTLRKLAIELQVPLAHSWTRNGLNTSLIQKSIRESLKSFRNDALYGLLLFVPIIAILVFLLLLISGVLSWCTTLSMFCDS
jgi:Fe2+ transport system protein B